MTSVGTRGNTPGVLVMVASAFCFAGLYFATPLLTPLPAEAIWAARVLMSLPFITAVLFVTRGWSLVADVARRVKKQPLLLLGLFACGWLLTAQVWLFGWAPLNGRGLPMALGYFLMPLVLVLVGRFLYRDRMTWWQWAAAAIAAAGVIYEVVRTGGLGWETLLVVIGYPLYFILRRSMGTSHLGGMWWELAVVFPVAAVVFGFEAVGGSTLTSHPALWWGVPLFALFSAFSLLLYLVASRMLPMTLFGLLGYVEPALLVVASLVLGERIATGEWPSYLAIWAAVVLLLVGGVVEILHSRRHPRI